ncbi:uncharacterized protein LOC144432025 [Styela clava]
MSEDNKAGLTAVSLKLPIFWTKNPAVWFHQVEAQFAVRNITTDETKYHYVVAALDENTAASILNVLNNPPETNKYQDLKEKLTTKCSLTDPERAARLCSMPGLGDGTATELMDNMLALYPVGKTPDFLFRYLFVSHLPPDVRSQLTDILTTTGDDFRKLAKKADDILTAKGYEVTNAVQKTSSFKPSHVLSEMCFYHRKFGKKAKKCRPPCSFVVSENAIADRQ